MISVANALVSLLSPLVLNDPLLFAGNINLANYIEGNGYRVRRQRVFHRENFSRIQAFLKRKFAYTDTEQTGDECV